MQGARLIVQINMVTVTSFAGLVSKHSINSTRKDWILSAPVEWHMLALIFTGCSDTDQAYFDAQRMLADFWQTFSVLRVLRLPTSVRISSHTAARIGS